MVIGKVVGTVVATRKHDRLVGGKIQVIQPLEPSSMEPAGELFVASMPWAPASGNRC